MSTTPAEKIERSRDNRGGRISACVPPANHSHNSKEIHCFALEGGT
jgi:hypothetical protein